MEQRKMRIRSEAEMRSCRDYLHFPLFSPKFQFFYFSEFFRFFKFPADIKLKLRIPGKPWDTKIPGIGSY